MKAILEAANVQLADIFAERVGGDAGNIMTRLTEQLVEQCGGWESAGLANSRRVRNPQAVYSQFALQKRRDLERMLVVPQFQIDSEWYCLETATSPQEDLWNISLEDLAKYIEYRVKFDKENEACEICRVDDACPTHGSGPLAAQPYKINDFELMTHSDWACQVMMIIRGLFSEGRQIPPHEVVRD